MCGICGVVAPEREPIDVEAARSMYEVIAHRGPDGTGEAQGGGHGMRAWFGHRRLKIIDLTECAHQPMVSDDGNVLLTYNGEIYNFRELRRELEARGRRFRSTGDTEVVLRAYEEWGEDAVARLDGMFAFAVWDGLRGRLLLARDRTGKKPLYYAPAGSGVAFGSEIKSLLMYPRVERRADLGHVAELMVFGYVPTPATAYQGIRQVEPGHLVTVDAAGTRERPYWEHPTQRRSLRQRPDHELIADLVRAAVERRLVADVPLGALLSGGIDSSIVVGLMSRAADEPVHTFSIGFPEEPSYDERSEAELVARHFGTVHREFGVQLDAVGLLDRLLWHHDAPFADSSAIPTYLVCKLAREHVKVVLTGDGGDEVFGGYDRFRAAAIAPRLPGPVAHAARAATRVLPRDHGYFSVRRRAERVLELGEAPVRDRYQSWISVVQASALGDLLQPGAWTDRDVHASMTRQYAKVAGQPPLDQILFANFKTYLPDDLAVKMDRMSMAHSLEARSPFLDTALIDEVGQIAARHKVGIRRLKPVLRQAFWPMLPREIWDRRKHGFGVPMGRWFRGELGTLFEDEVLAADARCSEVLRPEALRDMHAAHRAGTAEHGGRMWTILTLERWLRSLERPPQVTPPPDRYLTDAEERVAA